MNTRTVSLLFGIIFIGVGILGFTPNILVSENGIFAVNSLHNLVHILTGAVIIVGVIKFKGYENRLLQGVGIAYIIVTIIGFFTPGNMMLGLIHINIADRWLHLGLAIVILGAGFLPSGEKPRLTASNAAAK